MNDSFKNAVRGLSRALNALRGQGHGSIGDPNHKPGCPLCSAAELIEQSFYYLTDSAPAQSREEEGLDECIKAIRLVEEMIGPAHLQIELDIIKGALRETADKLAALRSRPSALGCGYWNGIECMVDADAITSRAAALPSPQGEDALADERETLEHWDEHDVGTLTNALESAIDAYDALRARLASAQSSAQGEEAREKAK